MKPKAGEHANDYVFVCTDCEGGVPLTAPAWERVK